jgi:transposase InsO family protein
MSTPHKDAALVNAIKEIWSRDHHYGVRRVYLALRKLDAFKNVNHKKVQRIMRERGLHGIGYRKKTRKYDSSKGPEGNRVKNRLHRKFKTDRPMHTDQGWQYGHRSWRKTLKKHNIFQSMSREATALDNAVIESFFNKFKVEIGSLKHFEKCGTTDSDYQELDRLLQPWPHSNKMKRRVTGRLPTTRLLIIHFNFRGPPHYVPGV